MKRNQVIKTLVLAGRNERNLINLSNEALRKLLNLSAKKIAAAKEAKAKAEAELFVRMEIRKEQQREQSRIEKARTEKLILRAKRESEEKAAIKRFENRGFVPLPKIGVTPEQAKRIEIREELARLTKAVEEAKQNLHGVRHDKAAAEAVADAVIQRKCFIESLPEEVQVQIRTEEYVRQTERPLFGSASFQK